jgi:hypothetical protein
MQATYVTVSRMNALFSGWETGVFRTNRNAEFHSIVNYNIFRGVVSHAEALNKMGYLVVDAEKDQLSGTAAMQEVKAWHG